MMFDFLVWTFAILTLFGLLTFVADYGLEGVFEEEGDFDGDI